MAFDPKSEGGVGKTCSKREAEVGEREVGRGVWAGDVNMELCALRGCRMEAQLLNEG